MLRIVALNEEEVEEESDVEMVVTKEAQETIAENEYVRAVKLKFQKKPELALSLLLELLDTKVLNMISIDKDNKKLLAIRYNCHKNIATISEEMKNFEMALENYVLAMQLDSSDVYTIHRFGQFVLKRNALELAHCAFDNCLKHNPSHWNAADGMLQTLCRSHNILGAYGWALKLYRQDPHYKRAFKILVFIYKTFNNLIPFYESIWGSFPFELKSKMITSDVESTVFPRLKEECKEESIELNLKQFAVQKLTLISVGQYITAVYKYLKEEEHSLYLPLGLDDIVSAATDVSNQKTVIAQANASNDEESTNHSSNNSCDAAAYCQILTSDGEINSPSIPPVAESNVEGSNEDSNSNVKSDGNETTKSKPRRRCSDLHFLEQWGWHKSRRYSSRKKPQQERVEVDTSLNGFLRRIFSKFTNIPFKDEWPFNSATDHGRNPTDADSNMKNAQCIDCRTAISEDCFESESQKDLDDFLNGLKAKPFDLMLLIYKWLKSVSTLWQKRLPDEMKRLFLEIFHLYINHYDFSTWNQLTYNNFEASYRICLLFLELEYSRASGGNGEISVIWKKTFDHLMYTSGCASIALNNFNTYKIRLLYLKYLCSTTCNELDESVTCLQDMEQIVAEELNTYVLHVPNLNADCLSKQFISETRIGNQRQLKLHKVPKLFASQNWPELITIIRENILHTVEVNNCENWVKDFKVQLELLLQAFWQQGAYEDCLSWCEKFFHYSTYNFLREKKGSYRRILWEESINFALSYIEAISINEGFDLLTNLGDIFGRLIHNIIRILSHYLDAVVDKNCSTPPMDFKRLWVILHQLMLREENSSNVGIKAKNGDSEDEDDPIPNSYMLLFTAHEFIGKHQWCTKDNGILLTYILDAVAPNLRAPLYDSCRDVVYEYLEQVTYCLYGHPQKKARSRHLEDHEASQIELNWPKAIQIFDLYRPDSLPEFNSYKLESVSADMEQLLLRIVALMPNELDPASTAHISQFISGELAILDESACFTLPFKINSIFYLLADYYFKNRDFQKAIKYYTLDLACNPTRFDSWAGMALSKASKVETKINMLAHITISNLLCECDEAIRCLERCIALNRNQTLLWIEYGSFTYTLHSYCSRHLKHSSENLSMEEFSFVEERKERMLNIAYNCFTTAATLQTTTVESNDDHDESNEEKWLSQYMLGKIAEKRKESPQLYLNYYLKAANYLYESSATYPIKINHNNPTTLSVEALEMFYRTNSAIIKYLEHESNVSREIGDLFRFVLANLSKSPFAFNKAKIDGNSLNALKRKIADKVEENMNNKVSRDTKDSNAPSAATSAQQSENEHENTATVNDVSKELTKAVDNELTAKGESTAKNEKNTNETSPSRRESQESALTGTNTTITSSTTSSTSSSDSSTSDSDTDSEASSNETDTKKAENNTPYSKAEIDDLYKIVVGNFEECVTRFPEHYKSIYRLVFHFLNGYSQVSDLNRCEQLLLDQYKTNLGNQINGLFYERKTNNLFNGIWRIPSSEIDRPGSFSAHLAKCISILIQMLMKKNNYKLLIDIGLQLYKTPDHDKRYIKDDERIELYKQCITYCAQILRKTLKTLSENRDDLEVIELLIDIYKIHKKCVKHLNQKEPLLTQLLIDVYKFYIQDKVDFLPENLNFLDLAIKLCVQQLATNKNWDKNNMNLGFRTNFAVGGSPVGVNNYTQSFQMISSTFQSMNTTIRPRIRPTFNKSVSNLNIAKNTPTESNLIGGVTPGTVYTSDIQKMAEQQNLAMIPNIMQTDMTEFQRLYAECYKKAFEKGQNELSAGAHLPPSYPMVVQNQQSLTSSLPLETTITPSNVQMKTFQGSTTLKSADNNMNCDITITTCTSKQHTHALPPAGNVLISANSPTGFAKPATCQQHYPDSINSLPTTSLPQLADAASNPLGKDRGVVKSKGANAKPYNRAPAPSLPSTSTDLASMSLLQNLKADIYNQQAKLLTTYADLLKNNSLQQVQMTSPKTATSVIRNVKGTPTDVTYTSCTSPSSAVFGPGAAQMQPAPSQIAQSNQNPFNMPMFDSSVITMTTVPSSTSVSNYAAVPKSTYSISQQPTTFSQGSPTKTLQQKLIERQKANQMNESKAAGSTPAPDLKSNIDVIILD